MPWTNHGKVILGTAFAGATRYVALHTANPGATGANELSGHGYSRGAIAPSQMSVNSTTGQVTTTAAVTIYTPNDSNAQDATHVSFWDAATGGNMLIYDSDAVPDVAVPANGQPVRLASGFAINI